MTTTATHPTATHPTVTCPTVTWCRRVHDESPLEFVLHESPAQEILSLPSPNGLSTPVRVSLAMDDTDRVSVLVGDNELALGDAEDLMAALRTALNQAYATLADLTKADR